MFDLVIFDEASQIRPSEALGATSCVAARTVVVGDHQQLPPRPSLTPLRMRRRRTTR